jgi:hypothetical protein
MSIDPKNSITSSSASSSSLLQAHKPPVPSSLPIQAIPDIESIFDQTFAPPSSSSGKRPCPFFETSVSPSPPKVQKATPPAEAPDSKVWAVAASHFPSSRPLQSQKRLIQSPLPNQAPPHIYQTVIKNLEPKWDAEGNMRKELSISGEIHSICDKSIGRGDSFICYKFMNSDLVVKVFKDLVEVTAKNKKANEKAENFHTRMDQVQQVYATCQRLAIPCASITNLETLKIDGYVLQEYVDPVLCSWSESTGPLNEDQQNLLIQFCQVLSTAMLNRNEKCWDLPPKNFGTKNGNLQLLDIPDRLLDNQWLQFDQAIRNWHNKNSSAKDLISKYLASCLKNASFEPITEKILDLLKKLNGN